MRPDFARVEILLASNAGGIDDATVRWSSFGAAGGCLLTGHTGFKGAWMSLWLARPGRRGHGLCPGAGHRTQSVEHAVAGRGCASVALASSATSATPKRVGEAVARADPQIVIHMAAQALVRESYRDPLGTYATNVMGTAALLQACRRCAISSACVIVTSDKVYENHGEGRAFDEGDRLGGHDPYSNSKACAELVTASFRDSFFADGPPIATARAGNVIGGGDWSEDRLIPDCVRALEAGRPVTLRYPDAVRPWQHVLEPLSGYLALAQALVDGAEKDAARCQFRPGPGILLHGARGGGRIQRAIRRQARLGARSGAAACRGAGADPVVGVGRHTLGWRPRLDIARIAVVDRGLVLGPFGGREHGGIFRSADRAVS